MFPVSVTDRFEQLDRSGQDASDAYFMYWSDQMGRCLIFEYLRWLGGGNCVIYFHLFSHVSAMHASPWKLGPGLYHAFAQKKTREGGWFVRISIRSQTQTRDQMSSNRSNAFSHTGCKLSNALPDFEALHGIAWHGIAWRLESGWAMHHFSLIEASQEDLFNAVRQGDVRGQQPSYRKHKETLSKSGVLCKAFCESEVVFLLYFSMFMLCVMCSCGHMLETRDFLSVVVVQLRTGLKEKLVKLPQLDLATLRWIFSKSSECWNEPALMHAPQSR